MNDRNRLPATLTRSPGSSPLGKTANSSGALALCSARARAGGMTLLLALALTSCKPHPPAAAHPAPAPAMKPSPPTPVEEKREELGGPTWRVSWDKIVEENLPPEMLTSRTAARDVHPYCPAFPTMGEADRRAFWAYFFQALAAAEAGLKPTSHVRHTEPAVAVKDHVTGELVRSEGLLQLTYEDSERYGCDFDWQTDRRLAPGDPRRTILQPENNLKCGIKILDNQLFTLHRPLLSRLSYWSTLRPGTQSYRVFAKQMTNVPKACHLAPAAPKRGKARGVGAR